MVEYRHDSKGAAPFPPPRCTNCDSHKTDVIGMSQDLKITYLRCATCGARSESPARDAAAIAVAR
jgi:hypothetical protein